MVVITGALMFGAEHVHADLSHTSLFLSSPPWVLFQGQELQFKSSSTPSKSPVMGIAESKILLGKLQAACSYAEHNGRDQVEDVLSDEQVCRSAPGLLSV